MSPSRVYVANGAIRTACERAFWPLFFTRLVTDVQLSPLQLVLLGTVYEAAIFLSEIPTGVVADVRSRRLSVIISYLVVGVAFMMSAAADTYALLIVSQVLVGVGSTFHSGAETAWITDELGSPEQAESLIVRRGQLQLIAGVVGIVVFAAVAALAGLDLAIGLTGAALVSWGLVLRAIMPEDGFTRTPGHGWAEFGAMLRTGARQTRRVPALRILVAVVILGGVAKEAVDRLDIQRLVDVGLPGDIDEAAIVGVLVAARLLLGAAVLIVVRAWVHGVQVVTGMVVLLAGVAAAIALLAHADLLAIAALGLVLQGGLHTATQPLVAVWANAFADSRARATIHSFVGQGESLGEVIGGIALGTVAQVFSVPTAMTISAVLFAIGAVYAGSARRVWPTGPAALASRPG